MGRTERSLCFSAPRTSNAKLRKISIRNAIGEGVPIRVFDHKCPWEALLLDPSSVGLKYCNSTTHWAAKTGQNILYLGVKILLPPSTPKETYIYPYFYFLLELQWHIFPWAIVFRILLNCIIDAMFGRFVPKNLALQPPRVKILLLDCPWRKIG